MNVAIVVAAGKGTRLGANRPKQFLELDGLPVIVRTLRQFDRCREIDQLAVVLAADEIAGFQSLAQQFGLQKVSRVIAGGATRAQSVQRGLAVIDQAELIAVHDGVRPFVTPAEIDRVMAAARVTGAAILVAPVADTIKEIEDDLVVRTLPRAQLRRALTPQCFRFEILKRAYDQLAEVEAAGIEVTDDCLLVERLGVEIAAIEGSARNIKITRAEDLALGEALLRL
ncbi:MAG: 2-C-methyl-D-erythritol 4-phosphate cytidylyltransferase [Blastocatellia bacterium]|jgi:2-C-methyl-D-erythritol 4-phosphate cytidylyltransferase|nr:2-C-methyl-D-erythritol 4-phosphate cytidylyltransferase [Blastocatellia bacterium]